LKDNEKYQELLNALLIKYGIKPDEDWTNDIVWKTLIDSKLNTKQRNLFYNEFTKLELKYKGMTYNSAKVSTHKIDEKLEEIKTKVKNNSSMKKLESGRTEYQEFLYSLFIKYGIDSPDESWSNSVWKVNVDNQINNLDRTKFYKELSAFNISTPSDEIWTHKNNEKLEKVNAENVKAAKVQAEKVKAAKVQAEKVKAAKVKAEKVKAAKVKAAEFKECPYCIEVIKIDAIVCKHCGAEYSHIVDDGYEEWSRSGNTNNRSGNTNNSFVDDNWFWIGFLIMMFLIWKFPWVYMRIVTWNWW